MGILSRIKDILDSNVNAILNECEDPAKMADQMLLNAKRDLAEVRRETQSVIADRKEAERKLHELEADLREAEASAKNALKIGDEVSARQILERKAALSSNLAAYRSNYERAVEAETQMRLGHDKLVTDIEQMEIRRDSVRSINSQAKAQERINRAVSKAGKRAGSMEVFDRMEEKAARMLDEAQAGAELSLGSSTDELIKRYGTGGAGSADVEDELARLKAEIGGEDA